MFGWRKKKDGFVWNEYVRTTILLRREQRKQRIDDVRDAAVDGIKHASKQGVALGVAGASAAGRGAWSGLRKTTTVTSDWLSVAASATWLWIADRGEPLVAVLSDATSRAFEVLRQPAMSAPLFLIGAVTAVSAAARWSQHGFDTNATISASFAALALLLAAVPQLAASRLGEQFGRAFERLPFAGAASSALRVGGVLVVAIGAVSWLVPALMSQPSGSTAVTTAVPVLTPASGRIEGKAVAIAGDQMRVGNDLVALFGIEAPAAGQICPGSKSCAAAAKAALQKLVGAKRVTCDVSGLLGNSSSSAACQVNGADIAGQLVRGGHVFATTGLFATYASAEREAKTARAGIWRTDPLRPAQHRAHLWDEAQQGAPDGCPIKGIVAGDAKTYIVPWAAGYEKAKIREERGERWFCTESEARTAGWKPGEPG